MYIVYVCIYIVYYSALYTTVSSLIHMYNNINKMCLYTKCGLHINTYRQYFTI